MTISLKPFFTYFGGKWRTAPRYPVPCHETIVEPFAGSAGYSVRYHDRKVLLIEKDPKIFGVWDYLIRATEREVLSLPDLDVGEDVRSLPVTDEARWLIGLWCNKGTARPCHKMTAWKNINPTSTWGPEIRARISSQQKFIRHWSVRCADYTEATNETATWFIDPPYEKAGTHYPLGSALLNFQSLGEWCQSRPGQVIVCENEGASWLPFAPFISAKASCGRVSHEALWEQVNATLPAEVKA